MPFSDRLDSVVLSAGFKLPQFNLFDGNGDPLKHLKGFIAHMKITSNNLDVYASAFTNSLMGKALDWMCYQASVPLVNKPTVENSKKRYWQNQLELRMVRKGEEEDNSPRKTENHKRPVPNEEV
ncbi:hypothetical protein LIER_19488 [Lithospermum erythrorhizon]|uniref:Uncharacterized protein n=1 Tax=Lithospermum erythrorhizon TaxID=34254 RepID=A0AAV3QM98_LITER